MNIQFNGENVEFNGQNLAEFMTFNHLDNRNGIAVAVNQSVIPKTEWEDTLLKESDKILIITAAAGG